MFAELALSFAMLDAPAQEFAAMDAPAVVAVESARQWIVLTNEPGVEGFGRINAAGYAVDITARRYLPGYGPAAVVVAQPVQAVVVAQPTYQATYQPATFQYAQPFAVGGFTAGSCATGQCARR